MDNRLRALTVLAEEHPVCMWTTSQLSIPTALGQSSALFWPPHAATFISTYPDRHIGTHINNKRMLMNI